MRFVALDEKTTKRPSPLMACPVELLGPFAGPPVAATDMVVVEGVQFITGPLDEEQVSRTKTSLVRPPPAADVWVVKTTNRPSSLIAGSWLLPASAFPALSADTRTVDGLHPLPASRQVSRK